MVIKYLYRAPSARAFACYSDCPSETRARLRCTDTLRVGEHRTRSTSADDTCTVIRGRDSRYFRSPRSPDGAQFTRVRTLHFRGPAFDHATRLPAIFGPRFVTFFLPSLPRSHAGGSIFHRYSIVSSSRTFFAATAVNTAHGNERSSRAIARPSRGPENAEIQTGHTYFLYTCVRTRVGGSRH